MLCPHFSASCAPSAAAAAQLPLARCDRSSSVTAARPTLGGSSAPAAAACGAVVASCVAPGAPVGADAAGGATPAATFAAAIGGGSQWGGGNLTKRLTRDCSEECLLRNIWAPSRPPAPGAAGYPVVGWIHGGGFTIGGARDA